MDFTEEIIEELRTKIALSLNGIIEDLSTVAVPLSEIEESNLILWTFNPLEQVPQSISIIPDTMERLETEDAYNSYSVLQGLSVFLLIEQGTADEALAYKQLSGYARALVTLINANFPEYDWSSMDYFQGLANDYSKKWIELKMSIKKTIELA